MPVFHRPESPDSFDYDTAMAHLAVALVETWHACEATGANLPEALSYALGLAARDLARAAGVVDPSASEGYEVDHELAVGVLVSQRPGSWEATHVRDLTFPVELLSAPEDIAPE